MTSRSHNENTPIKGVSEHRLSIHQGSMFGDPPDLEKLRRLYEIEEERTWPNKWNLPTERFKRENLITAMIEATSRLEFPGTYLPERESA